jgi:hypothetical protein
MTIREVYICAGMAALEMKLGRKRHAFATTCVGMGQGISIGREAV